jgi:phenylpropionate dioxygenase-like ring-hydroxylating dioxygenase large terminal subunit
MIKNQWYIACFENEIRRQPIQKRKIVGEEIVVFRNQSGTVTALEDRCCHRNVHLSEGYLKGNHLKCGYHGWEFNDEGKCVHIPMLEQQNKIPVAACVKKYPLQLKHHIYWVYIGDESKMSEAEIPPLVELDQYRFVHNAHVLKANIKLVAESLFDAQHINHVHRNSIKTLMGKLIEPKTDYTIHVEEKSLSGHYQRLNNSSIFEKIYFGGQPFIETKFAFWYPHTSLLDSHFPKHLHFPARRLVIYEHFYEIDEENVMMIQITAWKNIFRFNPWFAKWFMKQKSDTIVSEDITFLESNQHWHRKLELNDLILKGDEPTLSFMKLWNKNYLESDEKLD